MTVSQKQNCCTENLYGWIGSSYITATVIVLIWNESITDAQNQIIEFRIEFCIYTFYKCRDQMIQGHLLLNTGLKFTAAKNDSTSSLATISKKSSSHSFLLQETTERLGFFGAWGQLRIVGILCSGDVGVWHSSSPTSTTLPEIGVWLSGLMILIVGSRSWGNSCRNSRSVDIVTEVFLDRENMDQKWRGMNWNDLCVYI